MPAQPHSSNVARLIPREGPREGLRRAFAAHASLLEDKRREAAQALARELVDTAREMLREAAGRRDELFQSALASNTNRPPALIEAEARVAHLTDELAFAQEKLRQADNAVADAKREADTTTILIRDTARVVVADAITSWATRLKDRLDAIDEERGVLHGALRFCEGIGLLLPPVAHEVDLRQPPDFITRNTPGERTAQASAAAWREAFNALQVSANAPLPEEDDYA